MVDYRDLRQQNKIKCTHAHWLTRSLAHSSMLEKEGAGRGLKPSWSGRKASKSRRALTHTLRWRRNYKKRGKKTITNNSHTPPMMGGWFLTSRSRDCDSVQGGKGGGVISVSPLHTHASECAKRRGREKRTLMIQHTHTHKHGVARASQFRWRMTKRQCRVSNITEWCVQQWLSLWDVCERARTKAGVLDWHCLKDRGMGVIGW